MKIALIENLNHAKEYVKQLNNYSDFKPLTFNYESALFLKKNNISFLSEEKYETNNIYKNTHSSTLKNIDKLYSLFFLEYNGVEIWPVFYYDLYSTISRSRKYLALLKKIVKEESPEELLIFQNSEKRFLKKELIPLLISNLFKKRIVLCEYTLLKEKISLREILREILDLLQNLKLKKRLKKIDSNKKNILLLGQKMYFKNLSQELLKQDYRLFISSRKLRKHFFEDNDYEKSSEDIFFEKKKKGLLKSNDIKEINPQLEEFLLSYLSSLIDKFSDVQKEINFFKRLLETKKIDLILLLHDFFGVQKIIVKLAKKQDIPTIVFTHGVNSGLTRPISTSDYVFTYSNLMKKNIEKRSKKSKVFVTGSPRYDVFYEKGPLKKKKMILYGMEISPEEKRIPETHLSEKRQRELLTLLVRTVIKYFPEYQLLFKLKSASWNLSSLLKDVCEKENFKNFKIVNRAKNISLLKKSSVVIINTSTIGIESLALKTPVISLSYRDLDPFNYYKDIPFVSVVYGEKDLKKALQKVLQKKSINISQEYVNTKDSVKKSIRLINKIVKK